MPGSASGDVGGMPSIPGPVGPSGNKNKNHVIVYNLHFISFEAQQSKKQNFKSIFAADNGISRRLLAGGIHTVPAAREFVCHSFIAHIYVPLSFRKWVCVVKTGVLKLRHT